MKSMLNRANRWLDHLIFDSYVFSAEALGMFRIIMAAWLLIIEQPYRIAWMHRMPDFLFTPPKWGLAWLLGHFPPLWFTTFLEVGICTALVFVLLGFKTRFSSIALTVLIILENSFRFSLGKIDHSIMLDILPLVLSFSNWGAAYSIDANRAKTPQKVESWPIFLMALLLGFSLFSAGYIKLISGWLEVSTHALQSIMFRNVYVYDRADLLAPFFIRFNNGFFWEALDYFTIFVECLFLPAIFSPRLFRFLLALMVIFHAGVYLMMNIDFSGNLLVYMLFCGNSGWVQRLKPFFQTFSQSWNLKILGLVLVAYLIKFYTIRPTIYHLLFKPFHYEPTGYLLIYFLSLVVLWFVITDKTGDASNARST